eukprot:GFKZ01015509.1.p2 GENE.GFKZ01015509.1~~GFKZ01015509.1.p2  ORF type:complete len:281 (+),score=40.53 GFKZ01015509.1:404-1246(+)
MPAPRPQPSSTLPPSSTALALSIESSLRRQIIALRQSLPDSPRLHLSTLLFTLRNPLPTSPLLRAMRDTIEARLLTHRADDVTVLDVALTALDSFISVRVLGARAKVSAFFDQLVRERSWTSFAVFGSSTVAEAAFLAVNTSGKRLTVIDSGPEFEGRAMAKRLASATGAPIKYGVLANCHRLLDNIDAVIIGAEEVAMNGAVLSAPGSAVVVQVARELAVPVVVTTQAIKFSENMVVDWVSGGYDVIRAHEVLVIITEMDTVNWSPSSAPDILRKMAGV